MISPLRVKRDGADFAPVDGLTGVEIAKRGFERCAASFSLLNRAFHDFSGQVAAVELGY
ncbi:MAG: hypothetical protein FWF21_12840 [Micrococcales bacterium]|nr:hypothetical protein [Micrococcales bacterium]